jgi:hypothetical protein
MLRVVFYFLLAECDYAEFVMLSVVTLSVVMPSVVMLSAVMLSVVMLSVVMLSFVMLSVMVPTHDGRGKKFTVTVAIIFTTFWLKNFAFMNEP